MIFLNECSTGHILVILSLGLEFLKKIQEFGNLQMGLPWILGLISLEVLKCIENIAIEYMKMAFITLFVNHPWTISALYQVSSNKNINKTKIRVYDVILKAKL